MGFSKGARAIAPLGEEPEGRLPSVTIRSFHTTTTAFRASATRSLPAMPHRESRLASARWSAERSLGECCGIITKKPRSLLGYAFAFAVLSFRAYSVHRLYSFPQCGSPSIFKLPCRVIRMNSGAFSCEISLVFQRLSDR